MNFDNLKRYLGDELDGTTYSPGGGDRSYTLEFNDTEITATVNNDDERDHGWKYIITTNSIERTQ